MGMFKIRFGVILAILTMVIVLGSACGPGAAPSPSPSPSPTPAPSKPGGNQSPVISSLVSSQTQVYPSSIIEIRCDASDPDGDAVSYEWSAIGGSFSGTGPVVSWKAPKDYGNYDVKVTVKDGKGGITQASITLSVVRNQDPLISSLVAKPVTVLPQGKSTITCVASDPDGDVLNYNWRASAGKITGVGDKVTWIAPDEEGTYTITVTVNDGKGGQNARSVSPTVALAQQTVTFNPEASETGTVSRSGDKDTSKTMAGDSDTDESYRAFWSFDTYSLRGTDIRDAKLTFTTKNVVGKPFLKGATGLDGLHLWRVYYGKGRLPSFNIEHSYAELTSIMWEPPTIIDVTKVVRNIAQGTSDRLQLEASFMRITNDNHVADYIEWSSVTLTVTYAKK